MMFFNWLRLTTAMWSTVLLLVRERVSLLNSLVNYLLNVLNPTFEVSLRLALTGKKVLFLLPYISMAKERLHFLQVKDFTEKCVLFVYDFLFLLGRSQGTFPRCYGPNPWAEVRAWRRVDIQVAAFMGAQSAPSREWTAAVCTTEKANSLLNHAILDGKMEEIGLVVIDELHMVYDSSRGAVLESLCTKINFWNSR
ncbi:unnamed protein product [Angiostrongylus costaricensis]|uniref:Helicase ATP-binding domain-containing protein n=1 Tax=Angiostrongylus costaricensis TaxID=334426 RepID=A0A0R3PQX8_ANGCS|nr:unnamed protein product [Angiostrongylus costaricensis]